MNISAINHQSFNNNSANFKANLWVDRSVREVIEKRPDCFIKAAEQFDKWLQTDKKDVAMTMHIRKNTSLLPKMVFSRLESKTSYAYPHEETGYTYQEWVKKFEDLEFELGNRKCGFWFDPTRSEYGLLSDFKNMFNYLFNGSK